jgi:hypothetical protein
LINTEQQFLFWNWKLYSSHFSHSKGEFVVKREKTTELQLY